MKHFESPGNTKGIFGVPFEINWSLVVATPTLQTPIKIGMHFLPFFLLDIQPLFCLVSFLGYAAKRSLISFSYQLNPAAFCLKILEFHIIIRLSIISLFLFMCEMYGNILMQCMTPCFDHFCIEHQKESVKAAMAPASNYMHGFLKYHPKILNIISGKQF